MPREITFNPNGEVLSDKYITVDQIMNKLLWSFGKHAFMEDDEVQHQKRLQTQLDNPEKETP